MASGKRYEGVQALRFIAALLVVATHSTLYASDRLDPSIEVWHLGEVGVDIFFTISGFVMVVSTGSLVGTRDGWKYFGMRRLVRIAPMYWIATSLKVVTVIAIPSAAIHSSLQPANTVLSYVFLPSWNSEGRLEPVLGVGWTLTYEMFFYAVFTLALLVRVSPMWFCSGVLGACALATLLRPSDGAYPAAMFYLSPIVLYFVVGMAIGRWSQNRDWKGLLATLGAVVVLWTVIAFGRPELSDVDSVSAVIRNVAVSALLLAVVGFERQLRRVPRSIVFLGDASYSLYLFHPLVAPLVPIALGIVGVRVGWVSVVGSIAAAIVAAALIYRLVEMPMTAFLRERLPYMKQRSPAPIES